MRPHSAFLVAAATAALLAVSVVDGQTAGIQPGRAAAAARDLVAFGPRVAGTPVQEKASAYLIDQYQKAGYEARIATFTYSKTLERSATLTVGGNRLPGASLQGTVSGRVEASLVAVPGVGSAEDFASVDARGAIALVMRGELRFHEKAANAERAGAVGVAIVNNDGGDAPIPGTLGGSAPRIPVLGLGNASGTRLMQRLAAGERLSGLLDVDVQRIEAAGKNVVAHMPGVTRPEFLLGAHYDSVQGSPGANDNASGTSVILEVARTVAGSDLAKRTWFVSFDGEEDGLHGSRALVRDASPDFLRGLKAMMNFDMVGVNARLNVAGTRALVDVVSSVHTRAGAGSADGRSDYAPFQEAGVPVLSFDRGIDANYHRPTDLILDSGLLDETATVALETLRRLAR
ncbi:MAG TPA: M28 family metallopeptidase [Deinococcales bacterium]|nr:M28 family metallopeptidase [Deinococcales bacterium]